jgi:hypothetical protein
MKKNVIKSLKIKNKGVGITIPITTAQSLELSTKGTLDLPAVFHITYDKAGMRATKEMAKRYKLEQVWVAVKK